MLINDPESFRMINLRRMMSVGLREQSGEEGETHISEGDLYTDDFQESMI
jgi:hypothetical protein